MSTRKTLVSIILILIVGTIPLTSATGISEPVQRDVFLYQYFSQVLVRFEYSLKYVTMNNTYGLKLATTNLNELELINQETLYYQENGVNSTVTRVIPPFYKFSEDLVTLTNLTLEFQRNSSRDLAAGILSMINKMETQLRIIQLLHLRNGTKVLTFNTDKVQKQLEIIKKMAISKLPPTRSFTIRVSNNNPILYQNITIFGSSPWNDTITIIIKDVNGSMILQVNPSNGLFSVTYPFTRLGNYTIQAIHETNSSNIIELRVRKIPTMFITDTPQRALLNHTLTVSGVLVDYYGHRLVGRRILIGNMTTTTNDIGGFSRTYFSPTAKKFMVTLIFPGDRKHASTSRRVEVIFDRYPVSITLTGPSQVTTGKPTTFTGNITPAITANLTVHVNEEKYLTVIPKNGSFSFELNPKKTGEISIYVEFPGNTKYKKSTSNMIILKVTPPESTDIRYIGTLILGILLMVGAALSRRKHEPETPDRDEIKIASRDIGKTIIPLPKDVGEAYTFLRTLLRKSLGVDESLTPRETLNLLQGWELYPLLKRVTLLHEKVIYGGTPLTPREIKEFKNTTESIIRRLTK